MAEKHIKIPAKTILAVLYIIVICVAIVPRLGTGSVVDTHSTPVVAVSQNTSGAYRSAVNLENNWFQVSVNGAPGKVVYETVKEGNMVYTIYVYSGDGEMIHINVGNEKINIRNGNNTVGGGAIGCDK